MESNNLSKVFAVAGLIDSDLPPIKEQIQELAQTLNDETEYIADDGLIYCKKCHGCKVWISRDRKFAARCICKCEGERIKKENSEREKQRKIEKAKILREQSLLVGKYANITFENTVLNGASETFKAAYKRLKTYSEIADTALEKGYGIYLYGDCGVGKTHLTACLANSLFNQGYRVLFTNAFNISKSIRSTYRNRATESEESIINSLTSVDFLFIDDLGTEKYVDKDGEDNWLQERLYIIFNARLAEKKPTICTSNLQMSDLVNKRGLQLKTMDRLFELSSAVIKIEGENYRHKLRKQERLPF